MLVMAMLFLLLAPWFTTSLTSPVPVVATVAVLWLPVLPISLPKKNTSLAVRPVLAVALTITSTHFCEIALLAQISSTRSEPLTVPVPWAAPVMPRRTVTAVGRMVLVAQLAGELLLPVRNVKSLVMFASVIPE